MEHWIEMLAVGLVAGSLLAIPVGILAALAVFFGVRWLLLWFFRVNQALALLTESAATLRDIREVLRAERDSPEAERLAAVASATPAEVSLGETQPEPVRGPPVGVNPVLSEAESRALARLPRAA